MANYDLTYEGSEVQGILNTGNSLKDAGYIFRGEATPSTVPGTPTERVAYIGGPGTYTNFGDSITVPAGCVCIFKYTGSAWTNQVIDAQGASEGIFDLSAYNAQGGTLATYADLSAALTALNALPADFKKGGMSLKFVLSSDNKYMQFRLMSNAFSTTVSDWQGVVDEPLDESDDLVKGSGIPNKKLIYGGNMQVPLLSTIQAEIDADSNNELVVKPTAATYKWVAFFEVKKGHRYVITIPKTVSWEFSQSYCDDILTSSPSEDTNLGGSVNNGSYNTSESEKTINLISDRDGYFCVTYINLDGIPSVFDVLDGLNNICQELQDKQNDVIKDIVVDDRVEVNILYRDDLILQTSIILANTNYRTYYTPCKQNEKFTLNSLDNTFISIGFTSYIPELKLSLTNGSEGTGKSFYGNIITAPANGYFCISALKAENAPIVYKVNTEIGKDVYTNKRDVNIHKNLLTDVSYETLTTTIIENSVTPFTAVVGEKIALSTVSGMHVIKANIEGLSGTLFGVIRGDANSNNCVCITNRDDVILGFVDINYKEYYTEVAVDIDKYADAKYAYFTSGSIYQTIYHVNNPDNSPKSFSNKGTVILHFDGVETDINGTWIQRRKQIVQSYGWKASFCVSVGMLNAAGTDWGSTDIKNEFWGLIADGWDPMLYPNMSAVEKNEAEWNAWMDDVLAKFANVGVYNITTFACGNLAINDDLLNACIKHNFKIIRGGGVGSDNTYVYSYINKYIPQVETHNNNIILRAYMIGGDAQVIAPGYLDNIQNAIQSNGAVAIFSHTAYENLPSGDTVNISEDYLILILDYIKSLEQQGKIQVMSMGDFYAYANPQDCHIWDNNRLLKMAIPNLT